MSARKQVDRRRVLATALALTDDAGFEAVTMASVAARLGIRIPSLYNHVTGLADLRREMTLWGVRELADRLRRAAVGRSGGDALVSLADAYRAFAHAHPGIYSATLRAVSPDEPELAAAGQDILDILLAVLRPYGLGGDESLHVIRALRSLLHGFVDLEVAGGFGMALDRDESYRRLVRLFVAGLQSGEMRAPADQ